MDWFWFSVFTALACAECLVMAFIKGANRLGDSD